MVQRQAGTIRLVHVNDAARQAGLRCGMTLAEANALLPSLVTLDDDAEGDRKALESLAVWAQRFSPIVQLEDDRTLLIDVTGCQRLFGGDDRILRGAIAGVHERGFAVRAAIADTPGAAWAITHAHADPAMVVAPGRTAAAIAPLPLRALRIDERIAAALARVGVETVEALLHLPRAALAARFDAQLLHRLDQALGDAPEPLVAYEPPRAVSVRMQFAPTQQREVLEEALRKTLAVLCEKLARQVKGVRQLFATFDFRFPISDFRLERKLHDQSEIGNRKSTIDLNLSRASRSFGHWEKLLLTRLDSLRLPAPAHALSLWALHVEPLDDEQDELFDTDRQDARRLADLIDRLSVRLGSQAVAQVQTVSEHQPERAYRYVPNGEWRMANGEDCRFPISDFRLKRTSHNQSEIPPQRAGSNRKSEISFRPLRLLDPPCPITVSALFPAGPPMQFHYHGRPHAIATCVGPERIETGWWRGAYVQRDYYRVTDESGLRFWIFRQRDDATWYLHGWFD